MMWEELTSKMASPHDDECVSLLDQAQRPSAAGKARAVYQYRDTYHSRTENLILNCGK